MIQRIIMQKTYRCTDRHYTSETFVKRLDIIDHDPVTLEWLFEELLDMDSRIGNKFIEAKMLKNIEIYLRGKVLYKCSRKGLST